MTGMMRKEKKIREHPHCAVVAVEYMIPSIEKSRTQSIDEAVWSQSYRSFHGIQPILTIYRHR